MNEIPEWIPGAPELPESLESRNKQESAFSEIQNEFRTNYDNSTNPASLQERKKTGMRFLSSFDYVKHFTDKHVIHRTNGEEIYLPYNPIVSGFESIFEKDRDQNFPPIRFVQDNSKLPIIRKGNYTGKIGLLLNQPLYLIRTNFMLTPDGEIQRCVEQYIAALEKGNDVGEVWILNKWNPKYNFKPIDSTPRELVLLG